MWCENATRAFEWWKSWWRLKILALWFEKCSENGANREEFGEKVAWRLRNVDYAMCFSMWWQKKLDFPCSSKRFCVHGSCGVARFSPIFSRWSRGATCSLRVLTTFSLSSNQTGSRDFSPRRVGFQKQGFCVGACEILKQDTSEHVDFLETEKENWAWESVKNSLNRHFWRGFSLIFPWIFRIFPVFRVVGVSLETAGWTRKSTCYTPNVMCFR